MKAERPTSHQRDFRPDASRAGPHPDASRTSARAECALPGAARAAAPNPDAIILTVAASQHGIVGRAQLLKAGVPVYAIDNRVRNGRLVLLHRAVYRVVGPVRGRREVEMAAALACGGDAFLSHGSAASLLGLPLPTSPDGRTEVLVVGRFRRPDASIRVRRIPLLDPADRAMVDGVPVTGPARTLLDMASRVRPRTLEQATAWAEREGVTDRSAVAAVVARYPRARGAADLRALLARDDAPVFVRSEAEEVLLAGIARARVTRPRCNQIVEGMEVDFFWPRERLVVEVDGRAYHDRPGAFERDHRRDAALARAGYQVLRFTWRQLSEEPDAVMATIISALATGRLGARGHHPAT